MDDRLRAYAELLRERAADLGLIAEGDRDRITERHVDDSLRAAPLVAEGEAVCDIGSGAGLPGIPLAVVLPRSRVVLLEPRRRAVAFLELAVDRLALPNVEIVPERVEEASVQADVATARAFAPLRGSWRAACVVLRPGGRLVYFAGASFRPQDASQIRAPEAPATVEVDSWPPLVIMRRSE